jgi:hypothetical protein
MHLLFHSLYKNTSVVVCKNSTRVRNLNFPLWTCIHHRVVVYLNVSSRNMVTFSFCIFSNVGFFAYIMWNETLHIYLRWSPCIMVALSDESFQSKQFNFIYQISLNPNRNNKDMSSLTEQGIVALLSCRYHHRAISVLLIASLIFLSPPRRPLAILSTCLQRSWPVLSLRCEIQTGIHIIVAYRRSTMSTQRIKKSTGVNNAVMWDRNVSVFLEKSNWKAIALITSTRCKYARWLYNDECPVYTVYGLLF